MPFSAMDGGVFALAHATPNTAHTRIEAGAAHFKTCHPGKNCRVVRAACAVRLRKISGVPMA
jgi:hypothetical protein